MIGILIGSTLYWKQESNIAFPNCDERNENIMELPDLVKASKRFFQT